MLAAYEKVIPLHLSVGATASRTTTITAQAIEQFAIASGDNNPLHLDDLYAASTPFKRRIAHGMLTASLISAVIANDLPGPGTIYRSQTLQFKAPVFIGDRITATVELTDYRERSGLATLQTTCTNQDGDTVLAGKATVIVPKK